jgi:dihydrodipicolinate reductase
MLIFEHQALSRTVFARGALTAAAWLAKRKGKAKLYNMADVLLANS